MKVSKLDISLGFFMPASYKIIDSECHPVNPWVAVLEDDRNAYLWDYSLKSVLLSLSPKDLDEKDAGGILKNVRFLDPHILRWKWLKSQDLTIEAFQGKGKKKYWMIVVMEYKILFVDYRTSEKKTLHYSSFENKCISCIEFIDSSYLAIGFSDGSIRLFDIEDWEMVKIFPRGTHTKSITHLISYSKNLSQRSLLISAGSDGVIAVWNVDTCTDIPAFLIPSGATSAHSKTINTISLNLDLAQLCCVGSDKVVSIWNITNSTLVHKYKNLKDPQKKKILGGCFFSHPVLTPTTAILHSGSSNVWYFETLMYSYPKESQCLSLLIEIPGIKILNVKIHPLQPYLLFVTCEEGVYTVYYERALNLPFAFSQLFTSQIKPSQCFGESHFLYYYQQEVLCSLIFSIQGQVVTQSCQLATRAMGSKIQMKISPTGRYLSVLSATTGLFDIYSVDINPTKTPDRIKSGYSTHLVWAIASDRFACICPLNEDDTTGSFASIVCKILLCVYEINNGKVCLIFRGDGMPQPQALFGGNALAVSQQNDGSTVFLSWESLKPISKAIPKPIDVYWSENCCVLSYKNDFYVYVYKDMLKFMFKINHSIRTAIWSFSVFFYSTDRDIYWLMPCLKNPYLIASHFTENSFDNEFNIKEDKVNEKVSRKPQEYCSLVGIFQGQLLVISSSFKMMSIPIKSVFLRFCMLVSSGIVAEAMPLTAKMQDNLHPLAAKVLEFVGFPNEALEISGLPYYTLVKIAARNQIPIAIKPEILDSKNKLRKLVQNNKENMDFLMSLYMILYDGGFFDLALLVAITVKSENLISKTICGSDMKGRYEFRQKKLGL